MNEIRRIRDFDWITWIEKVGAQVWRDKSGNWTVQVWFNHECIQPTRATLRAALADAVSKYNEAGKKMELK